MEASYKTPLFVNKCGRLMRVMPEDVVCIEANRAYCNLYVSGMDDAFVLSYSMGCISECMPHGLLVHVGRSWCVNVMHIKMIEEGVVVMDNGLRLALTANGMKMLESRLFIVG